MNNFNLSNYHTLIFDFDGVFTNNKVYINELGIESIRCDKSDSLGFNLLNAFIKKHKLDLQYFVITKEKNKVVKSRLNKLKINSYQGIDNKLDFIKNYLTQRFGETDNSKEGVIYIGNDLNDLESILFTGFSFCPKDAHKIIKDHVKKIINKEGGNGFIRNFIEKIIKLDNLSLADICELAK